MSKHTAKQNLAALRALNDEISQSTISDKAIRGWAKRLDAVVAGCRDFTDRWMVSPPTRDSVAMEPWMGEWAAMSLEMQNVYAEGYAAARTPADFLKLDISVWAEPLEKASKALLDLFDLPCKCRTSRTPPARVDRPQSEYSPLVRQALIDAAARKPDLEDKPSGGQS